MFSNGASLIPEDLTVRGEKDFQWSMVGLFYTNEGKPALNAKICHQKGSAQVLKMKQTLAAC